MAQDTTISGFDAALKDVYAGPIRDQLNRWVDNQATDLMCGEYKLLVNEFPLFCNEKTRLLDLFTKGDIDKTCFVS